MRDVDVRILSMSYQQNLSAMSLTVHVARGACDFIRCSWHDKDPSLFFNTPNGTQNNIQLINQSLVWKTMHENMYCSHV